MTLFKVIFVRKQVMDCINNNRQTLIFINNIEAGLKLQKKLKHWGYNSEFVYASDENRSLKIEVFRQNRLQILISTTILERGVTFENIDVIVLDSDSFAYNVAALVQIAGRVNRKANDQEGIVIFCYESMTQTIESAVSQIKKMNELKARN